MFGPALAALALAVASAPASGAAPVRAPLCAWPEEVAPDALNIALPDTNARYWVMPYQVHPDREITITGTFPDDRYVSFTVYDGLRGYFTSNAVPSARADYEIAPDPGSVNPWQQVALPGGSYTLHLRMAVAPGQTNVLPLAPADAKPGQRGFLVYRTYLPAAGTSAPVNRPTLTVTDGGVSRTLPQCRGLPTSQVPATRLPAAPTADLAFARTSSTDELFPNPDSGYLSAWVTPPRPGDVVVIRGKAPSSPDFAHPLPWPRPSDDMRYWSLCTNLRYPFFPVVVNRLPNGRTDPGCRHDDVVKLDDNGWYTFAIGTEAQRPTIEALPGVTFVPFSLRQPKAQHLVLLRNMMPVPGFAQAVENVPPTGDPAAAEAVMGAYYPRGKVCALRVLAKRGASGCGLPG
jgi:hypothetical protein